MDSKSKWDKETRDSYYSYDQGNEHPSAGQGQQYLGCSLGGGNRDFSDGQAPGSSMTRDFQVESTPLPAQQPQAQANLAAELPQKNDQLVPDYDPMLHYSRYKPKTTRNVIDLFGLIVLIAASFMIAVHIPKYILVAMGYRKDPQEPDPPAFIILYIIFTIIFFPLIVALLAIPTGYYKYIIYKVKTFPSMFKRG